MTFRVDADFLCAKKPLRTHGQNRPATALPRVEDEKEGAVTSRAEWRSKQSFIFRYQSKFPIKYAYQKTNPYCHAQPGCGLRSMRPRGNFSRQREGIQLLSRPNLVLKYYECLLLLPFCGDCQGFLSHLGPSSERDFARRTSYLPWNRTKSYCIRRNRVPTDRKPCSQLWEIICSTRSAAAPSWI
jgi:hypothetical protein